jgi:hypothetical protein
VLRLTLFVSAIASASFAATLAFAPAVIDAGARFVVGQEESVAPAPAVTMQPRECAPLAKIVAALQRLDC